MAGDTKGRYVHWFKSSYSSGDAECVELAAVPGGRLIRDSKLGDDSPVLAVDTGTWSTFLGAVKSSRIGGS